VIRLICADVDGTLVGTDGAVHPEIWPAAERARAAGIRLAICSGRPAFGLAREYAERIAPEGGWHIFQNGASVVHLPTGRTHSARLPDEAVRTLVAHARATGRTLELYSDLEYAVEVDNEVTRTHAGVLGVPFTPRSFESFGEPVVRAQWMGDVALLEQVMSESLDGIDRWPSTSPMMPEQRFISLLPAGVNKGTGVRALVAEYGLTLREVMFVGDGWNDTPALELVGHGVAMANAEPEALAVARHVVGHVDAGGLAEALALAVRIRATTQGE